MKDVYDFYHYMVKLHKVCKIRLILSVTHLQVSKNSYEVTSEPPIGVKTRTESIGELTSVVQKWRKVTSDH